MASVERTAYPRFKRSPLAKELDALYTPTDEELSFALKFARRPQFRFGLLVLLKSFQRLGYFPAIEDVPPTVVQHIQTASELGAVTLPTYEELRTLYRHHRAIRERLGVSAWGDHGLRIAGEAMSTAAKVMEGSPQNSEKIVR